MSFTATHNVGDPVSAIGSARRRLGLPHLAPTVVKGLNDNIVNQF